MFNTENKTKIYGYDSGWVSNELIQFRYRFLLISVLSTKDLLNTCVENDYYILIRLNNI